MRSRPGHRAPVRDERAPRTQAPGGSKVRWKPTRDGLPGIPGLPTVPDDPATRPTWTDGRPCRDGNAGEEDRGSADEGRQRDVDSEEEDRGSADEGRQRDRDSKEADRHSGERDGISGVEDTGHRRARGKGRHEAKPRRIQQVISSIVSDRSTDRSEHRRRSAVAERPQNARPASILERGYANNGYHGRRLIPEARTEENQIANHSYRGSHRAGSMHHADDHTPAQRRSSRVGRHHAEPTEDLSGRW
nr:hypothetical protein [uncultured Actinoplanes sp.]